MKNTRSPYCKDAISYGNVSSELTKDGVPEALRWLSLDPLPNRVRSFLTMTYPSSTPSISLRRVAFFLGACAVSALAQADTGKLLLTGGVSGVEGAAGGGISPWAVIGSNASSDQTGVSAFTTRLVTRDYALTSAGVAVGWHERLEVSLARQTFSAGPAFLLNGVAPFGISPDPHLRMDVLGLKLRIAGDAVLDADTLMPQIAIGMQYKALDAGSLRSVLDFLGSRTHGTDFTVSATKLFLAQSVLLNGTLRYTNANQGGLLGFGAASPGRNSRSLQPEVSVAYLLRRDLAIGAEYRAKPDNLQALGRSAGLGGALREDAWRDLFVAWAPNHRFSLTVAWVDLGRIVAGVTAGRRQTGLYASGQLAF
jgi:hypothetical protein